MSATIQTSPISFVPFSFSATGTGTTETSVVRTTAAVASSSPGPSSADAWALEDLMGDITDLKVASAALLIGLVIASLTFGMVCTKAMSYFRGEKKGGALVLMTVSSMVFINLIQFIATVAAAYTSFVIDFGSWDDLLSTKWGISIQMGLVGLVTSIAHTYFAFRLHSVMRSMFLTLTILIFTLSQFAIAIFAATQMQQLGFVNILLVTHANTWTECTTYSIAAGINITIAAIAYVSIQKPYVLQKYGRTTFMEEFEYWTVKSLFGAALLSIVNAIQSTIMDVDMIWLAGTFIVGNLYTLSILLTVQSDLTAITAYTVGSMAPEARSDRGSVAHCSSTATLTNDSALWEDIVKAQTTKAALNPVSKESEVGQIKYDLGYGKIAAV